MDRFVVYMVSETEGNWYYGRYGSLERASEVASELQSQTSEIKYRVSTLEKIREWKGTDSEVHNVPANVA